MSGSNNKRPAEKWTPFGETGEDDGVELSCEDMLYMREGGVHPKDVDADNRACELGLRCLGDVPWERMLGAWRDTPAGDVHPDPYSPTVEVLFGWYDMGGNVGRSYYWFDRVACPEAALIFGWELRILYPEIDNNEWQRLTSEALSRGWARLTALSGPRPPRP